MMKTLLMLFMVLMGYQVLFPPSAYAYLDPGSGSYLLQLLVGFFVGSLFILKMTWHKVKTFFTRLFSRDGKSGNNEKDS